MKIVKVKIDEIKPYDKNPRKNDKAVDAVAESIRQCGYVAPIIVDEDSVILAGHTRYKALLKMGVLECDVAVAEGMTEEQKRKYRILDNKVGELAKWDYDLLAEELDGIEFDGYDFAFDIPVSDQDVDDILSGGEEKEGQQCKCPKCGFVFTR